MSEALSGDITDTDPLHCSLLSVWWSALHWELNSHTILYID